jgi:hypothetical protein
MTKMEENYPISIRKRTEALQELYNYLPKDELRANQPIKWSQFTRKYKISATFSQALRNLKIIKLIKRQAHSEFYIWLAGEPNIQMALAINKEENKIYKDKSAKAIETKKEEKKPKLAIRFPITIKFRSIIYIKNLE